jgi:hypothetical protein
MLASERFAPSFAGKGAFPPIFRLSLAIGLIGGLGIVYQKSCRKSSVRNRHKTSQAPLAMDVEIVAVDGIESELMLSTVRFYGWTENSREVDMDMREMVDKVKKGEELYGRSSLTPYMQGVAARNSRYSMMMVHVIPWANFFNHNQVSAVASADRWQFLTRDSG